MVIQLSERRSSLAFFFVAMMVLSTTLPFMVSASAEGEAESTSASMYNAGGNVIGDLDEFDPSTGSEYLFIHEEEPVVSATSFMR
ncbi:MAG: hypothetical protein O3C36_07095 [archaeon]|nr:hypothetical protein [archaeon]